MYIGIKKIHSIQSPYQKYLAEMKYLNYNFRRMNDTMQSP